MSNVKCQRIKEVRRKEKGLAVYGGRRDVKDGMMECWNDGVGGWKDGIMECWNVGMQMSNVKGSKESEVRREEGGGRGKDKGGMRRARGEKGPGGQEG